ncbi:MAG TPA: sulfur carrier protein ThiS [Acidiferrobacter sp.]|nr:sulfur carrier protein ThiS [Acidiferrobacter sp.]
MRIYVNGSEQVLAEPKALATLLEEMGLAGKRVAVEVNREIVPRTRHALHFVQDGDHVEVVQAIGGG